MSHDAIQKVFDEWAKSGRADGMEGTRNPAFEPAMASAFSVVTGTEPLTPALWIGGLLLLGAMLVAHVHPPR